MSGPTWWTRAWRGAWGDQRGDGTVVFVGVLVAPLLSASAALSLDLSDKLAQQRRVALVAGEAARAAGQALNPVAIQGEGAGLEVDRAATAARVYLQRAGVPGAVSVHGMQVTVTTSLDWSPRFMPLPSATLTATRSAESMRT